MVDTTPLARPGGPGGARAIPGRPAALPVLLDIPGVATHLGITERHVRRLVAERRIPFLKVGRFVRFDPAEVAQWLGQARVPPHQREW